MNMGQKIPDPYTTHKEQSIHRQMVTVESKDTLTNRTFEEYVKGMIVEKIRKYDMNQMD